MAVKNEIGNKYGRLTVISRAENTPQGAAQWLCKCECGSLCVVSGVSLRSGNTKSCGCLQRERAGESKLIDEVGNRYGRLTVIERAENAPDGKAQWLCKCDCGNLRTVSGVNLRSGHTKSCGCLQRERARESNLIDEVGNKYGRLTVLERAENTPDGRVQWLCKCDCGTLHVVSASNLRGGQVKSCGCIKSSGEEAIAKFLTELGIKFQKGYTFDDLRGVGGRLLRFDFAIFSPEGKLYCLIEFDGVQHHDENSRFYSEKIAKHDQIKNDYCIKNNIRLIRLTDYENLTIEDLL